MLDRCVRRFPYFFACEQTEPRRNDVAAARPLLHLSVYMRSLHARRVATVFRGHRHSPPFRHVLMAIPHRRRSGAWGSVRSRCSGCARSAIRSLWSKLDCKRARAQGGARGAAMESSSGSSRPAKLARLQDLRNRLPQLSQSALSAVLKVARDLDELPDAVSTKQIREARNAAVLDNTPYGTLHKTVTLPGTAKDFQLEIQSPHAALWAAANRSAAFAALLAQTAAKAPPSADAPWRLILYFDEVLPGNIMNHKGARKIWACYWSFVNFGGAALAHEDDQASPRLYCNTSQSFFLRFKTCPLCIYGAAALYMPGAFECCDVFCALCVRA